MTWAMYEQLARICEQLRDDASVRVVRFRGAGGQAFVAGTDIAQFQDFSSGDDGVAYERRIDAVHRACSKRCPCPPSPCVEGWAIGGGLAIATACDFRIATPGTRFGVPIARTLGNCLSMANVARLVAAFGRPRVERLLLLADLLGAEEALACGFLLRGRRRPRRIDAAGDKLCAAARRAGAGHAAGEQGGAQPPAARDGLPDAEDLIRAATAAPISAKACRPSSASAPGLDRRLSLAWSGR